MSTQASAASPSQSFQGNDRLLFGIILGVVAFWMFAQTTLNIAPGMQETLGMNAEAMNIAVSITSLFSGIFIVVFGGLADRLGRLKVTQIGFILSIIGSLLVAITPANSALTVPVMLAGRALQGLSAACIMPASLALLKAYWEGPARQRAISLWSIGSWGGSGLCSLFGGFMQDTFGWRSIFWLAIVFSVIGLLLMRGTPESKVETKEPFKLDVPGILTFMVAMIAIQVFITQGGKFGWASPVSLGLLAVTFIFGFLFVRFETQAGKPFFDFKLFKNSTFTGATISNFLLNGVAGMLIVSLQLLQIGGGLSANESGWLTLGYAIAIIAFIRVGEKLLQRFGARKPMIWGCLITAFSIALLLPTNLMLTEYKVLAIVSYTLFGVGLAFYATPSTDAALSNLPAEQSGAGAGIYKMASSLGAAFGVAISAAIFTAIRVSEEGIPALANAVDFVGRQDNVAVREAAMIALGFNLFMVILAIISIMLTVPKGKKV